MKAKHYFKKVPLAIMLTSILTGCSLAPQSEVPDMTLSQAYTLTEGVSETSIADVSNWWMAFNDPVLNALVEKAQQQNIPLKMASERIQMAQSYQQMVASFKVPTVSLGAGYYNYQISENDPLLGAAVSPVSVPSSMQPMLGQSVTVMDQQNDGFFAGANISWELDLFGRLDNQSDAAAIRVEQVVIYQEALNTLITADVIHNYIQYRGAKARYALANETIEDQKRTLALVEKMVNSGYGSELDLAKARTGLISMQAILPQLNIAAHIHQQRLGILLAESNEQMEMQLSESQPIPELTELIPVGLPSDLLKRRADIRIAEREIAALDKELGVAVANRYPKVFLTGGPGLVAGDVSDLFSSDSLAWGGAVGVNWNIFDGGRGEALVDIQEAKTKNAMLGYQHTVNGAFSEVETVLYAYDNSQQYQQKMTEAANESEKALDKARSLYKAGLINHLAVLDAQRQHNMIKERIIAAQLQTAQSIVSVHKALGGDWKL
ncbi:outer membrane protein [Psychromonas marina]|uniref:Outer membrane protein n=1 Tax=Psychromonas marina TaxID=88364 RepID=A0ABQ6E3S3_9GAMM|nr:efflux transporter outer membrane subunit [Psychromonas marina]GLS92104.1 outer membrane protein [Psychromonas marina]